MIPSPRALRPFFAAGLLVIAGQAGGASAQEMADVNVGGIQAAQCETSLTDVPMNLGTVSAADGHVVSAFQGTTVFSIDDYSCNTASTVTLAATPLTTSATTTDTGFTARIDYRASLNWNGEAGVKDTADPGDLVLNAGAGNGLLTITLSHPDAGINRPLAGTYTGEVVLTVTVP